jgi:hypothetical protein
MKVVVVIVRKRFPMKNEMICPLCGVENNDNWPVAVNGVVKQGGCQDCWEKQSDKGWWKMVKTIYQIREAHV